MDESWLKNKGLFHSYDYNNYMFHNLCVIDLLLQDLKIWNVQVFSYLFHKAEANLILQVPLFISVTTDACIWEAERNGKYSIISTYWLPMDKIIDLFHLFTEDSWRSIWKLQFPTKAKFFPLRACWDCLPTQLRLRNKGIDCSSLCVLCRSKLHDDEPSNFDDAKSLSDWFNIDSRLQDQASRIQSKIQDSREEIKKQQVKTSYRISIKRFFQKPNSTVLF